MKNKLAAVQEQQLLQPRRNRNQVPHAHPRHVQPLLKGIFEGDTRLKSRFKKALFHSQWSGNKFADDPCLSCTQAELYS